MDRCPLYYEYSFSVKRGVQIHIVHYDEENKYYDKLRTSLIVIVHQDAKMRHLFFLIHLINLIDADLVDYLSL
jgi:hypothetical protein